MIDDMPQDGLSLGGVNSLGTDFLNSFILSPCATVSTVSNAIYSAGVFKYVGFVYTL